MAKPVCPICSGKHRAFQCASCSARFCAGTVTPTTHWAEGQGHHWRSGKRCGPVEETSALPRPPLTRDYVMAETHRALLSAFPERAAELLGFLEGLREIGSAEARSASREIPVRRIEESPLAVARMVGELIDELEQNRPGGRVYRWRVDAERARPDSLYARVTLHAVPEADADFARVPGNSAARRHARKRATGSKAQGELLFTSGRRPKRRSRR